MLPRPTQADRQPPSEADPGDFAAPPTDSSRGMGHGKTFVANPVTGTGSMFGHS
jgi:hypothetical protein